MEPAAAHLLELPKLSASGPGFQYAPSRNRQCHMYAVTQKRDVRSLALKRVFVRCAPDPRSAKRGFFSALALLDVEIALPSDVCQTSPLQ